MKFSWAVNETTWFVDMSSFVGLHIKLLSVVHVYDLHISAIACTNTISLFAAYLSKGVNCFPRVE